MATTIEIEGSRIARRAKFAIVCEEAPEAFDGFATPDAISMKRGEFDAGERFITDLPPGSVTIITMEIVR